MGAPVALWQPRGHLLRILPIRDASKTPTEAIVMPPKGPKSGFFGDLIEQPSLIEAEKSPNPSPIALAKPKPAGRPVRASIPIPPPLCALPGSTRSMSTEARRFAV